MSSLMIISQIKRLENELHAIEYEGKKGDVDELFAKINRLERLYKKS
jgi:uncharacterized protein (UPF0335 family)